MTVKVLHIINSLGLGGAQKVLKYFVENSPADEVENFIYPLRDDPIDIVVSGNIIKHGRRNYDPRKVLDIIRICRRHDIDIIHTHLHKAVCAAVIARLFCRAKIVLHEHGAINHRGGQYSLYRFLLRFMKHFVTRFIAVSKDIAGHLRRNAGIPAGRIDLIYNGIDSRKFVRDERTRRETRCKQGISEDDIVLGFVGRLDIVKGIDILLDAMGLLSQKYDNIRLLLCGDGKQRDVLGNQVAKLGLGQKVIFLGFQEDVVGVLNAMDLAVLPSRDEAFPLAPIEFMYMGIPVACSGVGGLAEIVLHNQTGLVFDTNTAEGIAQMIETLIEDENLRNRLVSNAKDFVQQFGINSFVSKIVAVYKSVRPDKI